MTDKEKKVIFSIIGIMLVILLIVVAVKGFGGKKNNNKNVISNTQTQTNTDKDFTTKLEDGTEVNTSKELNENKMYKGLEITNIQFSSKDSNSRLTFNVKNTGSSVFASETVPLKIVDKDNKEIASTMVYFEKLNANESRNMSVGIMGNIVNAKNIVLGN